MLSNCNYRISVKEILLEIGCIEIRFISSMGRRLEKYYLFCYTTFLSLFTMKFVLYVYRKFPIYIGNLRYTYRTNFIVNKLKKVV